MRFNEVGRVILFGGAPVLVKVASALGDAGYDVLVFTSPRHAMEVVAPGGLRLDAALERLGMQYWVVEDINSSPDLLELITPHTMGIGLGEAWSFGRALIDAFEGSLVDFMGIPLPRYRGGAHYSWMILSGERRLACNIQMVNEDMVQGFHDSGAIVFRREYQLSPNVRTPQDCFEAALPVEASFIEEFLALASEGHDFTPVFPDDSASLFFPRLNTVINGWLDWSWSGKDVERFVCAFDTPYPGAGTLLEGRAVRLSGALLKEDSRFHPFQSGLVVRVNPQEGVVVATTDGLLAIRKVSTEDGAPMGPIVHGMRFHTPREKLDASLRVRVSYDALGSNEARGSDAALASHGVHPVCQRSEGDQ